MSSSKRRGCALSVGNSSHFLLVPVCPTPGLCSLQNDNSKMSWDICFHLCKYVGYFLPSPPCCILALSGYYPGRWITEGWAWLSGVTGTMWVLLWCYSRLWDVYTVLGIRKTTDLSATLRKQTRPGLSACWDHAKCRGAYWQMQMERWPASVGMGFGGSVIWKLKLLLKVKKVCNMSVKVLIVCIWPESYLQ